jgi:enoyl-CoA hydratase/carnithine racemase
METTMVMDDLVYQVNDNVGCITINREKFRNAISMEAVKGFISALDEAENDPRVRVVLVTGAGEKAFCAGADLGSVMSDNDENALAAFKDYARLIKKLAGFPRPTVARVNGTCIAGGTGFMLACDIVVASGSAKFGTPEVNVGLFPMMIGALIFKNVLKKKAMEMILLGDLFDAEKALDMGMITRIASPENLDGEIDKITRNLASKSPAGLSLGKKAFYEIEKMNFDDSVDFLAEQLFKVMKTEDAKEGITAFMEKRKPEFTGR